jgi:hypothetical protein
VRGARRRHLVGELELDVRRKGLGQPGSGAEQDRHEVDRELVDEARAQELVADGGAAHDGHGLAVGGLSCLRECVLDAGRDEDVDAAGGSV